MMQAVGPQTVHDFISEIFDGVIPLETWGETAFFYNPGRALKRGTYFATIKEKDGDNDRASNLNRDGYWRLNIGVGKPTFLKMFGQAPARPAKGCTIEGPWDFSEANIILPHPVYGWMGWLAVTNPDAETFEQCKPLIIDAHRRAAETFNKRVKAVGGR